MGFWSRYRSVLGMFRAQKAIVHPESATRAATRAATRLLDSTQRDTGNDPALSGNCDKQDWCYRDQRS